jgi:hypothetical protein
VFHGGVVKEWRALLRDGEVAPCHLTSFPPLPPFHFLLGKSELEGDI